MGTSQPQRRVGYRLAIATWAAILGTLLVNSLSNIFPLAGKNVGEISNTVLGGVLITPASYAFAIWGLIYIALIAYAVYQSRPMQRRSPTIRRVDRYLIVACVVQMGWIVLFTLQQFWLSVVAMLGILIPLMLAYSAVWSAKADRGRRRYGRTPLSLYLAWISVATVINVASAFYSSGWSELVFGPVAWTAVMVVVSALIGAAVIWPRRDIAFTAVLLWAYAAIALRHLDTPVIVAAAGLAGVGVLGALVAGRKAAL